MEEYPFTKQDLARWKEVHAAYAPRLSPNRKTAAELLRHLKSTYVLTELFEPDLLAIVTGTIEENEHYRQKLPHGAALYPRFFRLEPTGAGQKLYAAQESPFHGCPIYIGLERTTAFFCVEGSAALQDALIAFMGLDAFDLKNPYLVYNYLRCTKQI